MKLFTLTPQLHGLLERMSRDMAVPIDGLVNQAIFNWARLHGYSQPAAPAPSLGIESDGRDASKQRRIVLVLADRETVVDSDRFLVGRDASCNLTIDSPRISRHHAVIRVGPQGVELEDLGSSNGTWFRGKRVTRLELSNGDEVHFGDTAARVEFRRT